MQLVERDSKLWEYFPEELKGLIQDGENLLIECHSLSGKVSDYSYLVFPFAKAYEGFLKIYLLDLGIIREEDFYSDDIRIGRILNPVFMERDFSVFAKLKSHHINDPEIPQKLWDVWTRGRNQVFHYFPHNFRRLSKDEALHIIHDFIHAMEISMTVISFKK